MLNLVVLLLQIMALRAVGKDPYGGWICSGSKYKWESNVAKMQGYVKLEDLHPEEKKNSFEASALAKTPDKYLVAYDNKYDMTAIKRPVDFDKIEAELFLKSDNGHYDSQFEGLTYDPDTGRVIIVQETVDIAEGGYRPNLLKVTMDENTKQYNVHTSCHVTKEFRSSNKGIEGLWRVHPDDSGLDDELYFALCEGNYCEGGDTGKMRGAGRILVVNGTEYVSEDSGQCAHGVIKEIYLPPDAYFKDYSDLAFFGDVAVVVSQEDSAMWFGRIDYKTLEFDQTQGRIVHFPRDESCEMILCNVEGIQFVNSSHVLIVSDRVKSSQPAVCKPLDQTFMLLQLPFNISDKPIAPDKSAPRRHWVANLVFGVIMLLVVGCAVGVLRPWYEDGDKMYNSLDDGPGDSLDVVQEDDEEEGEGEGEGDRQALRVRA